ncbi:hypothetical protein GCM10007036_44820 [Alsobacter metallidurans]|uniref:CobQ/CobB/MinD/ParA nucleotide binding domain-containing protein n=1 Tax=Alsobacter metallidurans TaxID=340221 RepID=A0A917IBP7_9HYPH|nr:hypothetical protein [Alsobacter metallidurans]GGH32715.1 hypothetical protein GCM10007036_44820 [Alsobacter metallidurans]
MASAPRPLPAAPTLISVAHAGGQGKTTTAQLLYLASKKLGQSYGLYAADFTDESGRSKLGKLYPDRVTEFGVGASLTAARTENNANAALRYWDKVGPLFLEGGAIVDLGANVIQSVVAWGADRNLAGLMEKKHAPKVDLFCVCKAQKHAFDDIANLIETVVAKKPFRLNRIFIVKNEVGGSFEGAGFEAGLKSKFPDRDLIFVTLPACQAEIWPAIERNGVSLEAVLEADEDQLMDMLDVDLWTASSGLAEVRSWFDFVFRTLKEADVFTRREVRLAASKAS